MRRDSIGGDGKPRAGLGMLLAVIFGLFLLTLFEDALTGLSRGGVVGVGPRPRVREVTSCGGAGAGGAGSGAPAAPAAAAALVRGDGGTAVFDAAVVAATMGLFGAFTRVQRGYLSFKMKEHGNELTDRRHTFPLITGDGFRMLSDYIADRAGDVSSLATQLVRDDTPLFARLRAEQALIVFLGNDDPTLPTFFASGALDAAVRPIVLVVLNGDNDGLSLDHAALEHPKLLAVFTQNCVGASAKVVCVPIGLENRQWSMHGWTPETIMGGMLGALRGPSPLDRLRALNASEGGTEAGAPIAFACFGVHTWPQERGPLASRLDGDRAKYGWINRECNNGLVHFHRNMLNAAVVVCPRGHGLDTLRMWEALYLGRVIVTRSNAMDPLWEDLPVVLVRDWEAGFSRDIVADGVRRLAQPDALARSRAATKKLFIPYWACLIGTAAKRADEFCSDEALLAAYSRAEHA
jgi:hypothetical protein